MTRLSDRDYYLRRLRDERALEAAALDDATAHAHAKMIAAYTAKLAALDAEEQPRAARASN
jgi:hypothetical protein